MNETLGQSVSNLHAATPEDFQGSKRQGGMIENDADVFSSGAVYCYIEAFILGLFRSKPNLLATWRDMPKESIVEIRDFTVAITPDIVLGLQKLDQLPQFAGAVGQVLQHQQQRKTG